MYVYIYSSVLHISDILQGANLCKSIFLFSASYWCTQEVWVALKNMARVAVAYTSSNSYAALELSKLHGCILT